MVHASVEALQIGSFGHFPRDFSSRVIEPWRLFAEVGPVLRDGSCTAEVANYSGTDLTVYVDFPTDALGKKSSASAALAYKTWIQPLSAEIVPSGRAGITTIRATVPQARAVLVSLEPSAKRHRGHEASGGPARASGPAAGPP